MTTTRQLYCLIAAVAAVVEVLLMTSCDKQKPVEMVQPPPLPHVAEMAMRSAVLAPAAPVVVVPQTNLVKLAWSSHQGSETGLEGCYELPNWKPVTNILRWNGTERTNFHVALLTTNRFWRAYAR